MIRYYTFEVLDSFRIAANDLKTSFGSARTKSLTTEIWTLASEIIRSKNLRATINIQQGIPEFLSLDQERVVQCVLELVSNAVRFISYGEVLITVNDNLTHAGERSGLRVHTPWN